MSSFDRNEEEEEEKDEGSPFPPRRSSLTGGGGDDDGDEDDDEGNSEEAQFLTDLNENHTKKSNTTKVLSTYGGAGTGVKNHFLHVERVKNGLKKKWKSINLYMICIFMLNHTNGLVMKLNVYLLEIEYQKHLLYLKLNVKQVL